MWTSDQKSPLRQRFALCARVCSNVHAVMNVEERGPVALPPPVVSLTGLLAGLSLEHFWPGSLIPGRWAYLLGAGLAVVGGGIAIIAHLRFRRAGTPFDVRKRATALVTEGPIACPAIPVTWHSQFSIWELRFF